MYIFAKISEGLQLWTRIKILCWFNACYCLNLLIQVSLFLNFTFCFFLFFFRISKFVATSHNCTKSIWSQWMSWWVLAICDDLCELSQVAWLFVSRNHATKACHCCQRGSTLVPFVIVPNIQMSTLFILTVLLSVWPRRQMATQELLSLCAQFLYNKTDWEGVRCIYIATECQVGVQ